MGNKKEINNKSRKTKNFFIIDGLVAAISLIGFCGSTLFVETPIVLFSSLFVVGFVASAIAGIGGIVKHISKSNAIKKTKKKSLKNIEKISDLTSESTLNLSRDQKIKIVKKYAKQNLKLCKTTGCPVVGKLPSVSGFEKNKQVKAFNELDNLELLKQTEATEKKRKKIDKKISKKKKILAKSAMKSVPHRYTKNYEDFVDGISIYDRRIEIGCLNQETSQKFQTIANKLAPTDEVGGTVMLTFKQKNKTHNTYARVSDVNALESVRELMLKDVLLSCQNKAEGQASTLFPFTIDCYSMDRLSTKIKNKSTKFIQSEKDLISELGLEEVKEK